MINKKKKSIFDWIMDIILIALSLLIIVWLIYLEVKHKISDFI